MSSGWGRIRLGFGVVVEEGKGWSKDRMFIIRIYG